MSDDARPITPTFRFGASESPSPGLSFTFTPNGSVTQSGTMPRRPSSYSTQHLSPDVRPSPGTAPQARSVSPHYRFGGGLSDHRFTFAEGWIEPSSSTFGRVGELRDALPTVQPSSPASAAPHLSGQQNPPLSNGMNDGGPRTLEYRAAHPRNEFEIGGDSSTAHTFDQQKPTEFSLRALHNTTPLPSRGPSPQPTENSALFLRPRTRNRTSDVSAASGWEEDNTPYDVREEAAPVHPFFTAGFQSTLQAGLGIARATLAAVEKLDSLVEHDSDLEKLLDDASRLCAFEGSDTKTIAVLGDSGEGKSSLINSLLHFPGIAQTGDLGSACTSVVTEYRQKTRNHTAPITIEVEHLSPPEIEEVIQELLWNYRQPYLKGVEDDPTADDHQQHGRESARAWSALGAAFKHQPGFGEEMLRDMSEGALERLTSQLIKWSHENDWPEGAVNGLWQSTANSAEECVEKTAVFMQDRYWPFTKIIRVYLSAQVLKTGVVLADLPGLQDTNLARVRATHDYLLRCNHIFIVTKISRAITDLSLQSSLFSVLSRHVPLEWEQSAAQSLKIAVVCTWTEEIDLKAARKSFCGPGKPIPASVMEDLDAQIDDAKASRDEKLKKTLKKRRELLLMNARNNHVTSGLQRAYAAKAPDGRLDVFCVSNKWYDKYTRKGKTEFVRGSGVPDLRQFCYSITADAQLREARHFLQARVFGLVNSVELWAGGRLGGVQEVCQNEASGDGSDLSEVVPEMISELGTAVDRLAEEFRSCFADGILQMIDNQHRDWKREAKARAGQWSKWAWQTYDAWCRNNGSYSIGNRTVDWNAEIVWKMRAELAYAWDMVEEEIDILFGELLATVAEQFGTLTVAISVLSSTTPSELHKQLLAGFGARAEGCKYSLTRAQEKFAGEVKLIRRYVSESSPGSYILDAMLPAYRAASKQFGTGKKAKQRKFVESRIADGVLFPSVAIALQERVDALLEQRRAELKAIMAQAMAGAVTDIKFVLALASRTETEQNTIEFGAVDRDELEGILETLRTLKTRAEDVSRTAVAA